MEFTPVKKTKRPKVKMMLWLEADVKDSLESLQPTNITVQEKIRQIIDLYLEEGFDDLGGL